MRAVARAAEGFDRRAFTVSEFLLDVAVAASSLAYDREGKAQVAAKHKMQIVDALHRTPYPFAGPRGRPSDY